jgi:phosphopantetheinyl transferase
MGAIRLLLRPVVVAAAEVPTQATGWLTPDEMARLQAITEPVRRSEFLAGHWLVRVLAGQWLGCDPQSLALVAASFGQPRLQAAGADVSLHVSLSHSGGWLAVALAPVPVGVDLELSRRPRDWQALARALFAEEESRALDDAAPVARAAVFHRVWTLKEAYAKRDGRGLTRTRLRTVVARPAPADQADAWCWPLGEGALALAAAPGMVCQVDGAPPECGLPSGWRYQRLQAPAARD